MFKFISNWLDEDQRQLRNLVKSISADQAEIFLKKVHPNVWSKLLVKAKEQNAPVKFVKQKPSKLSSIFKILAGGVLGVGVCHYSDRIEILKDPRVQPYITQIREKSDSALTWIGNSVSGIYNRVTGEATMRLMSVDCQF